MEENCISFAFAIEPHCLMSFPKRIVEVPGNNILLPIHQGSNIPRRVTVIKRRAVSIRPGKQAADAAGTLKGTA
jgi:hypothetical protein